ncbi:MAG: amidohydrolase [Chloroflexi bacterium]|nr:amidohydrolase [Chloroflexota bacterium]MCH7654553.1 amidohydrolase [Chloroflexota bacterium]
MLDGQKILDAHAHTNAPPELYAYKAGLLSSRGYHGKGNPNISDERLAGAVKRGLDIMDSVGTDMQFLSPRPFQLIHSEKPAEIVDYFCEANNDVIARVVKSHPDRYAGVCALPHHVDEPDTKHLLGELGRCINDLGFIGCMINPDPGEGAGYTPPMDDEYWYPLYEEMVKLDVPALIHSAACKDPRESYSAHFITVESQVILNLIKPESNVFKDFPKLKIIVAHGGGSVPYQIGRWRASRFNAMKRDSALEDFDTSLKRLYFDTVLYNKESLDLLFRLVGSDRCMFGTENPGSGTSTDPVTNKQLDDTAPVINSIEWLSPQDRKNIFEDVQKKVFPRLKVK